MERIIELLEEIKDDVDYETCETLIDDGIFDSFDIIQTINSLKEEFDIEIPDEAVEDIKTIGDIVKYIENNQ